MSHHTTLDVQKQIIAKMSSMFKKIVQEEDIPLDPAIGDTAALVSTDEESAAFAFTHKNIGYVVTLTEEYIDGILSGDEECVEYLDGCVYGIIADLEDLVE